MAEHHRSRKIPGAKGRRRGAPQANNSALTSSPPGNTGSIHASGEPGRREWQEQTGHLYSPSWQGRHPTTSSGVHGHREPDSVNPLLDGVGVGVGVGVSFGSSVEAPFGNSNGTARSVSASSGSDSTLGPKSPPPASVVVGHHGSGSLYPNLESWQSRPNIHDGSQTSRLKEPLPQRLPSEGESPPATPAATTAPRQRLSPRLGGGSDHSNHSPIATTKPQSATDVVSPLYGRRPGSKPSAARGTMSPMRPMLQQPSQQQQQTQQQQQRRQPHKPLIGKSSAGGTLEDDVSTSEQSDHLFGVKRSPRGTLEDDIPTSGQIAHAQLPTSSSTATDGGAVEGLPEAVLGVVASGRVVAPGPRGGNSGSSHDRRTNGTAGDDNDRDSDIDDDNRNLVQDAFCQSFSGAGGIAGGSTPLASVVSTGSGGSNPGYYLEAVPVAHTPPSSSPSQPGSLSTPVGANSREEGGVGTEPAKSQQPSLEPLYGNRPGSAPTKAVAIMQERRESPLRPTNTTPREPPSLAGPSSSATPQPSAEATSTSTAGEVVEVQLHPVTGKGGSNLPVAQNMTEGDMLRRAIELSERQKTKEDDMVQASVEEAKSNARTIRQFCEEGEKDGDAVDLQFLNSLLEICKQDRERINKSINKSIQTAADENSLLVLLDLNENINGAVKMGEETLKRLSKKQAEFMPPRVKSPELEPGPSDRIEHRGLDIRVLVEKKDIFSLICMMRAQQNERRLLAALALMKFARDAELDATADRRDAHRLRDEIRSSGGMLMLLTVFRTRNTIYELKVVAALAVAYVLPSFVNSGSSLQPSLGLKIMECLRFLSTCRRVYPAGQIITKEETFKASALGLTSFWMNQLEPMLNSDVLQQPQRTESGCSGPVVSASSPYQQLGRSSSNTTSGVATTTTRMRGRSSAGGGVFDQRQESIELHELMEMTVSLIIHIAKQSGDKKKAPQDGDLVLVEQVCSVELARPIAVREGILRILVEWIGSGDREKIRPAISALRSLTSIQDKYMAGWIHSQMVNEGALQGIVVLTHDLSLGHDVRLAIAQILSSLCDAAHTRAAVVEANCVNFLIGFLYEHSETSTQEVALYAGSALLRLAAGAITRASVFSSSDDVELLGFVTPDKRDTLVDDIVGKGAIGTFVGMCLEHRGKLRSVAVEALRVLSEDISPIRQTRLQLCDDGAARALGITLKESVGSVVGGLRNSSSSNGNGSVAASEQKEENGAEVVAAALPTFSSDVLPPPPQQQQDPFKAIHEALCALANILDPVLQEGSLLPSQPHEHQRQRSSRSRRDPKQLLIEASVQIAESGGLEALLTIASISFADDVSSSSSSSPLPAASFSSPRSVPALPSQQLHSRSHRRMDLLGEACRSLAFLSPLLLSDEVAQKGYAAWTDRVLKALHRVLAQLVGAQDLDKLLGGPENATDLYVNVLSGLGALARSEPLKVRIVENVLALLLQAKSSREGTTDVSNAASQAFQTLEFAEDEVAVQVAGNNPNLLADWFCLQRSLLFQAMARAEIRQIVSETWRVPFQQTKATTGMTSLMREVSSADISVSKGSDDGSAASGTDLFENFCNDEGTITKRETMLRQYGDTYDSPRQREGLHASQSFQEDDGNQSEEGGGGDMGLFSRQVYPLNCSATETDWILKHRRFMSVVRAAADQPNGEGKPCATQDIRLSEHVGGLLDYCFPSRLLRDQVLPIHNLRTDASFNFRVFMMPQRRYFSFRREGQLLSRLCDKEASALDATEVHWSLGFTNSSFAGEFAESLVQVLYICPMIHGLSFCRNEDWPVIAEADKDNNQNQNKTAGDDGVRLLANLAGSLPPWISYLTFDGLFNGRDLVALVAILETMGKLSTVPNLNSEVAAAPSSRRKQTHCSEAQVQGKFRFFSVRRSPGIAREAWVSFFGLLGRTTDGGGGGGSGDGSFGRPSGGCLPSSSSTISRSQSPLSSLKSLDLSGNALGDELCAVLLELLYAKESGCSLERIDLSGNEIGVGTEVTKVFRNYVEHNRYSSQNAAMKSNPSNAGGCWRSSLHTLNLSENALQLGRSWFEIVSLLKHNALELKSLDLSSNGLALAAGDYKYFDAITSSIQKNTCLCHLNLSDNRFSLEAIDRLLGPLTARETDSGLAFLQFEDNSPPLTDQQRGALRLFSSTARKSVLQRFVNERERLKMEDMSESGSSLVFDGAAPEAGNAAAASLKTRHDAILEEGDQKPSGSATAAATEQVSLATRPFPGNSCALASSSHTMAQPGDNMISVLFSAPLVYADTNRQYQPFAKLDLNMERELMWQCLKEASRDIQLSFDNATPSRLLSTISTKPCSCLHYSGHGHEQYLPFEDGKGGVHWLGVEKMKQTIAREGGAPFRFVFVSACHSYLAGETFASAGVPHVVCCQQESELKDTAALAFTRQFYLALAVGHTVKESFEQGCKAVRASPNLRNADKEMEKFVLLPRDGDHDVPIFNAKPVMEWPPVTTGSVSDNNRVSNRRTSRFMKSKSMYTFGGARSSELSVRNMIQEDPSPSPPQFFLGREVDTYCVLQNILDKRLVSVVGETGVGRSSLVCFLCHYINERQSTIKEFGIERIYFVKVKQGRRKQDRFRILMDNFIRKLVEADKAHPLESDADIETMFDTVCKSLKNEKALVVFDRVQLLAHSDDANEFPMHANEFPMLLSNLFRETRNVRVLLTADRPQGIASLGGIVEHPIPLGPLTFSVTVKLFSHLCPFLHTPAERRKLFETLVTDREESEVLPTYPGLSESTRRIFALLGDGIPSRIEKAAYNICKNDFLRLWSGSFLKELKEQESGEHASSL